MGIFLHCLTEPLGFASRAVCCDPKGQKSLFLFYTAPEVSSVSRTCGFRMTLSHWGQAGSHCCSSPAVPWYRWIKPALRGYRSKGEMEQEQEEETPW